MAIDPTRSPEVGAGAAGRVPEASPSGDGPGRASERARADQVEISEEARSLAEQAEVERVPFTEARAAEVRERLDAGFYASPDVIRRIAEKLADSGDL